MENIKKIKKDEYQYIKNELEDLAKNNLLHLFCEFVLSHKDFEKHLDFSKINTIEVLFDIILRNKNSQETLIEIICQTYLINDNSELTFLFDLVDFMFKNTKKG